MPRRQSEGVNQSARQLSRQEPDNARQSSGGRPQRPQAGKASPSRISRKRAPQKR
jgi:hypothetical protein